MDPFTFSKQKSTYTRRGQWTFPRFSRIKMKARFNFVTDFDIFSFSIVTLWSALCTSGGIFL
jgi:hypothetical protein